METDQGQHGTRRQQGIGCRESWKTTCIYEFSLFLFPWRWFLKATGKSQRWLFVSPQTRLWPGGSSIFPPPFLPFLLLFQPAPVIGLFLFLAEWNSPGVQGAKEAAETRGISSPALRPRAARLKPPPGLVCSGGWAGEGRRGLGVDKKA